MQINLQSIKTRCIFEYQNKQIMKTQTYYKVTYTGKFGNLITCSYTLNATNLKDVINWYKEEMRVYWQTKYASSKSNTFKAIKEDVKAAFGYELMLEKSNTKFIA